MEKSKVTLVLKKLDKYYGTEFKCFLNYKKDYELLFATMLSAQCTDERVNETTKTIFKKYKTLKDFANAKVKDLEKDIMPCGFYHAKAKNIILTANKIINEYNGKLPCDTKELIKLNGVGRKTANVLRSNVFKIPSIVCDTHVIRVSNLLGLGHTKDPIKLEEELMEIIPKKNWSRLNPQLITLGRTICKARKRECEKCFLNNYCEYYKKQK